MINIWKRTSLETPNLANRRVMNKFPPFGDQLIEHYLQYQPKELVQYVKEFDFQCSDNTDEEMTLLIDMLIDSRDVYSQHKFDVGKTRQKFHVTLKPNVELKRQRPSKYHYT